MALDYAATSSLVYVSSGTTISSATIPAAAVNGSFIVAYVMGRSAITPPAGWTLAVEATTTTLTQRGGLYYKVASGDASTSPTWTQAASGRMGLQYHVFTGGGTPTLASSEALNNITSWPQTIPNDGALAANSLCLNVTTQTHVTSSNNLFTYSGVWKTPTTPPTAENRMIGGFIKGLSGFNSWGTMNSTEFTTGGATSATAVFTFSDGIDVADTEEVSALPVLVLWELAGGSVTSQLPTLVLYRALPRRIIGITD